MTMTPEQVAALKASRQIEIAAEAYAAARNWGEARKLFREMNRLRADVFGTKDPFVLRTKTYAILEQQK